MFATNYWNRRVKLFFKKEKGGGKQILHCIDIIHPKIFLFFFHFFIFFYLWWMSYIEMKQPWHPKIFQLTIQLKWIWLTEQKYTTNTQKHYYWINQCNRKYRVELESSSNQPYLNSNRWGSQCFPETHVTQSLVSSFGDSLLLFKALY